MVSVEPHVLLFAFPAQGHVPQMLNLAELLTSFGLRVTFLNTVNIHNRFLANSSSLARFASYPRFRFRTISDGLPEDHPRPFLQFLDLEESLRTKCREEYREMLLPNKTPDPDGWPPVTCVVVDGILSLASEVAEEMDIPAISYRTSGACAVLAYYSIPQLIETGEILTSEGADLDERIKGVPSMESFLRRKDLPSMLRNATTLTERGMDFVIRINTNINRGKALILNTFESLESAFVSQIRSTVPKTYTIGPVHLLLEEQLNDDVKTMSLWKEDKNCIAWLDSQPDKSVVYVSFGSVTVISRAELLEFWHGLVNSGHRFLWVLRSDILDPSQRTIPTELVQGTKQRGCIVEWATQRQVLSHKAVACFLTHSGWNSTLESIVGGVPMICWPFFADQLINSRVVSEVWKIGLDMKDKCCRSIVEDMIREMMEGENASNFRRLAAEMAEKARSSVKDGGSSYTNLQKLVQLIKDLSVIKFDKDVGS